MDDGSYPLSIAGIECLFSLAALVHIKLRSHLTNNKVAKLVRVCCYFSWNENIVLELDNYPIYLTSLDLFGIFSRCAYIPFHIPYYSLVIILASASSSCFSIT